MVLSLHSQLILGLVFVWIKFSFLASEMKISYFLIWFFKNGFLISLIVYSKSSFSV